MSEDLSREEIACRAERLYDERLKTKLEPEFEGKIVAIDVDSGDYEVDDQIIPASRRLKTRHPNARLFALRVGYDAVYALSGRVHRSAKR